MTKPKRPRATIEQAYFHALAVLAARPEVTGVDIGPKYVGTKRTNKLVVRIHVREKLSERALTRSERIPKDFLGVPTDIIAVRYMRHGTPLFPSGRFDPLLPGISVGNPKAKAGTIGLVVSDNASGVRCILSAFHVLAGPNFVEGDPVLQPSRFDGGSIAGDKVGTLFKALAPGLWGDAALAKIGGRTSSPSMFETGVIIDEAVDAKRGMRVVKTGRTTLTTRGRIEGLGTYYYPDLPAGLMGFRVVPHHDTPNRHDLCAPGDSGALYYVEGTTSGVGLHCAGGTDPVLGEVGIACHLTTVLTTLDATIVT